VSGLFVLVNVVSALTVGVVHLKRRVFELEARVILLEAYR
jgi:hypothetical protein